MIARAQKYGLDYFDNNNEMTEIIDYADDWNIIGLHLIQLQMMSLK